MRHQRRRELALNRQSLYWHQSEETKTHPPFNSIPAYHESHYTRMLIEDVHNGVMPYSVMSKWPLSARVEPPSPEAEEFIEDAISDRDYRSRLYEVVAKFVHDCSSWMMTYGRAIYEIAYLYNAEDIPVAFVLLHILPPSVKLEGGKLMQHVPESVKRQRELLSDVIELSPENIVIFELPAYMRDDYAAMMSALYSQGSITAMPDFVLKGMKGEIAPVPFDLNKFSRDQNMAVAEATRLIGWNARQIADDKFVSEYYYFHRFLLFEHFKIEVREAILRKLNEGIARAGKKLGFAGQIVLEGVPSSAIIQDAQKRLEQGGTKFNDIMKPFHAYT